MDRRSAPGRPAARPAPSQTNHVIPAPVPSVASPEQVSLPEIGRSEPHRVSQIVDDGQNDRDHSRTDMYLHHAEWADRAHQSGHLNNPRGDRDDDRNGQHDGPSGPRATPTEARGHDQSFPRNQEEKGQSEGPMDHRHRSYPAGSEPLGQKARSERQTEQRGQSQVREALSLHLQAGQYPRIVCTYCTGHEFPRPARLRSPSGQWKTASVTSWLPLGRVAELVDALGSGPSGR